MPKKILLYSARGAGGSRGPRVWGRLCEVTSYHAAGIRHATEHRSKWADCEIPLRANSLIDGLESNRWLIFLCRILAGFRGFGMTGCGLAISATSQQPGPTRVWPRPPKADAVLAS